MRKPSPHLIELSRDDPVEPTHSCWGEGALWLQRLKRRKIGIDGIDCPYMTSIHSLIHIQYPHSLKTLLS